MLGVLRAMEEKASEAAPNKLPRLREGGLDGCDGRAEGIVGVIGGDVVSVNEVEGGVVVTMACAVCGRLVALRVIVLFVDKGGNADGGGDETMGEYVTNEADAAADGRAANGSATSMR